MINQVSYLREALGLWKVIFFTPLEDALLSSPELNRLAASHCLSLNWALDIFLASAPGARQSAASAKSDPRTFGNMTERMEGGTPPAFCG